VSPYIFAGGAEKVALHLAQQLGSMGCEVGVASLSLDIGALPHKFKDLRYIQPEKPLAPSRIKGSTTVLESTVRESYALSKLLREHAEEFDILNPFNFPSYWATFFAQTKKPVVWNSSEVFGPYRRTRSLYERSSLFRLALGFGAYIDRYIVKYWVDEIVTCSKLNSRLIEERYGRASRVVPTCVDFDFFSRSCSDAKESLGFQGNFLLLHVGSLVQSKNHILSIRALHLLKKKIQNIKLVIVGTGFLEDILKNEVNRLGLKEDVIFKGVVTEEDLWLLFKACDVNLYPVRDQTYGLVPFEALAAGKPSIVSNDCGAAEIIESEKIGILIKSKVESLTQAVTFALSHPEDTQSIVDRGQRYVRENLTWEKYAREMFRVFRNVLELNT
jgi:glycosyltransferase involved in cell wall biosynthesis